jgi:nicotinate-nucleotide adenylyltransferase
MDQPTADGRRIAFFGGSFDPPHLGHLAIARAAQKALDLDTVLFAPVGTQPLKPQGSTASFAHRLAMTQLAIASDPEFAVSLADAPRASGQPNYTLETLRKLRAALLPESALFLLMGADSLAGLRRWHGAAEIPFVAPLIVASRPGQQLNELEALLPEGLIILSKHPSNQVELQRYILRNSTGEYAPLYVLPGLEIGISASEIRERLRQVPAAPQEQRPAGKMLPASVFEYIYTHGLYR